MRQSKNHPKKGGSKKFRRVLLLGSGALKIGEAGEFDYSGSQAIKALKEEGIFVILINPNIATVQTSADMADKTHFLPVTSDFVEKVVEKEKPDGIMLSFGGQTALNCGLALYKKGVLKKHGVQVLGSPIESIMLSEDRDLFARHLQKLGIPVAKSRIAKNVKEALDVASEIGYPVMIRAGFSLGGLNSGVSKNEKNLKEMVKSAFKTTQNILIEQCLLHFKEIEYEVVRDSYDNAICVCNMENMDPVGIHTGESIVVAPSQTLTNTQYHFLRSKSLEIARSLGIVGECNVQFAVNPRNPIEYYVIELNARLSRSSALASKATGYPLAYVAAKLALGKNVADIPNKITKVTGSFFEPSLDYLVVKVPRWDTHKFKNAKDVIGSSMKSVGEVMAIGRTFEEAIQKAMRMLEKGDDGVCKDTSPPLKSLMHALKVPTGERIFAITSAIMAQVPLTKIAKITGIDTWFLKRLENVVSAYRRLPNENLTKERLLNLKQLGFADETIAKRKNIPVFEVRKLRKKLAIKPSFLQIDTLAGEVPAKTNYLYATYNASHHDVLPIGKKAVIVLGSGPYRIGSSVEFDWCCVQMSTSLKKFGYKSIIINSNPETVSTDYDISDRLYFEELTEERVLDIHDFEKPKGVVTSTGGQTPNNLSGGLEANGVHIIGTPASTISQAEHRASFSAILDELKVEQPYWATLKSVRSALAFAKRVGYPVLLRPSFVLSGMAMTVCYSDEDLRQYIVKNARISERYPIVITRFMKSSKEIEYDGVAYKGHVVVGMASEHIERAGVHSGDAHVIYPAQKLYSHTVREIEAIAASLIKKLAITGPFNIQFLAKNNKVFVIELNARASRTFPLISKASGLNLIDIASNAYFGKPQKMKEPMVRHVVVKAPQFSFARIPGADPLVRVEMASTGEVGCFGDTVSEAMLKAMMATGFKINGDQPGVLFTVGGFANKERLLDTAWLLARAGFMIYTTEKTFEYLKKHHIPSRRVYKVYEDSHPNVIDVIESGKVSAVINVLENTETELPYNSQELQDGFLIRRASVENGVILITDASLARYFAQSITKYMKDPTHLKIKAWGEYVNI